MPDITAIGPKPGTLRNYKDMGDGTHAEVQMARLRSPAARQWTFTTTVTSNSVFAIRAGAASTIQALTAMQFQNTNGITSVVNIMSNATVLHTFYLAGSMASPVSIEFPTELQTAVGETLNIQCTTTGTSLIFNAQGYSTP